MTERHNREYYVAAYDEAGRSASYESRLAAGKLATVLVFATKWGRDNSTYYVSPASEYLSVYAGEAEVDAMRELEPLVGPDWEFTRDVMEQVFAEFKAKFPLNDVPHRRRHWVDVIRHTKAISPCYA